jgi:hypothetical protein
VHEGARSLGERHLQDLTDGLEVRARADFHTFHLCHELKQTGCACLQAKETVIDMPSSKAAPKAAKQRQQVDARRQSLLGSLSWALLTGAGMLYIAAVLCLCAWPVVHFIVQFGLHASLVSAAGPYIVS